MARPPSTSGIPLEHYCILCQTQTAYFSAHPNGNEVSWDEQYLGFLELKSEDIHPKCRGYMFRLRPRPRGFSTPNPVVLDQAMERELAQAGKRLIYDALNGHDDPELTANVTHVSCLQLARMKLPQLSIRLLCRTARILRPIGAGENARHLLETKPVSSTLPWFDWPSTDLGLLMQKIQESLPRELHISIFNHLPDGLFSSLVKSSGTLDWLEMIIQSDILTLASCPLECNPFSDHAEITKVGAKIINILGENCLAGIQQNSDGFDNEILINPRKQLKGLQVGLGLYGVVALRLHYSDGSVSAWLGNDSPKWHKFILGSDFTRLQVHSDGFKILSLNFDQDKQSRPTGRNKTQMLWDHNVGFIEPNTCSLLNFAHNPGTYIRGNPNTRYGNYLPLNLDDGKAHSLTVFSDEGTYAIQIDGSNGKRIGRTSFRGCSITLFLKPNEGIQFLYMITRGHRKPESAQGPFFLTKTTQGRCFYFGKFLSPDFVITPSYISSFGLDSSNHLTGIFCSPPNQASINPKTWGITVAPKRMDDELTSPTVLDIPILRSADIDPTSLPQRCCWDTYCTTATFHGCESIQGQKVGRRFVGLLAERGKETCVLGQWDPSSTDTIFTLHSKQDGPINKISFIYSEELDHRRYVADIVLNDCATKRRCFEWDDFNREIAWFFTVEYDHVELWRGTFAKPCVTESAATFEPVSG